MYSKNEVFSSLPKWPFELCKQSRESLLLWNKTILQNMSTIDSSVIRDEIERLKSEHALEIQELKKEFEVL